MKDIKTKDAAKKDIKVLDKAGNLAKAVRDVSVRTKDQIGNLADDGQVTPEEYANDKIKYMAEDAVEDSGKLMKKGAKKTYEGGKDFAKKRCWASACLGIKIKKLEIWNLGKRASSGLTKF